MNNENPSKPEIWYAFQGKKFKGGNPSFYEIEQLPFLKDAGKNYKVIRKEIENLLSSINGVLQPYFNSSLVSEGKWEVVNFYFWGKRNERNCAACPELDKLLQHIPGLLTVGLSRLAPHTEIDTHIGDTNGIARCHLGLSIPAGLPACGLEVNGEQRAWKEGEWMVFCDAYPHRAWNKSDQARYILLLDFVLPEFKSQQEEIVKNMQSWMKLQDLLERKIWMKKLPGIVLGLSRNWYKYFSSNDFIPHHEN